MAGFGPPLRPASARTSLRPSSATARTNPSLSCPAAATPLGGGPRRPPFPPLPAVRLVVVFQTPMEQGWARPLPAALSVATAPWGGGYAPAPGGAADLSPVPSPSFGPTALVASDT